MDVLKNEGYLQYDRISRYSVVPIYYNTLRDNYVSGSSTYLNNTTNYTVYKVKYKDTYDKIALKFYNNPSYFGLYAVLIEFRIVSRTQYLELI